jgi:putative spermidine/putrescine transport system ATP-binding protein
VRIRLQGLTKRFGAAVAVDDLSLDIAPGELVALVGGSGCGKTTTLRMIAGFEHPDAGDVLFDDRVVTAVPPRLRGIGIVFQSYALFPTMTVADNVAFGLTLARWPAERRRARVAEMLELTGLAGLAARRPYELSGGQQQRVALARALARRPPILLLDEPLSALDAKIRLRLRGEIRRLQQDLGVTAVYVTHDQEEALSIADRIAVMRGGRIEQIGRPEEIYAAPRTEFVADFIGVANLLRCRVLASAGPDGLAAVEWHGERWRVAAAGAGAGETVIVSIRPEKLGLVRGATDTRATNTVEGVLDVVTFLGATVRLEVRAHGQPLSVDVAHDETRGLERKQPVVVAFSPTDAVVIPADAGASAGKGDRA